MASLVWTPSKKALEAGFPDGIDPLTAYNIDESDVPKGALWMLANRTHRHRLNNEAASALLAAQTRAAKKGETVDSVAFLHAYRLESCQEVRDDEIGFRAPSGDYLPPEDPTESEARDRAFDEVLDWLSGKGHKIGFKKRNAKSESYKDADGVTIGATIDRLLSRDKPTVNGLRIWAAAEKTIADREAARAGAPTASDEAFFAEAAE